MQILEKTLKAYPNLLASAWGRSVAFFSFYFIDGVLIAFMATSIAMRMRAQNVGATEIGFFVATLYLPASWKWLFGPLVDLCYSERLGRRRGWILGTEALMIVTLLAAMPINFVTEIKLFTIVMMLVNLFAAMQRIAVNALACNILTRTGTGDRQRHDVCRRLPGAGSGRLRRDLALRLPAVPVHVRAGGRQHLGSHALCSVAVARAEDGRPSQ